MNLVLSSDSKPRLKWTPELHQRFVEAINQLGGAEKATPKSLMRMMGIPGLTLHHLKSHLQKFRLGKTQLPENLYDYNHQDYNNIDGINGQCSKETNDGIQSQMNESLQIPQALNIHMEVQRKLHEQIEVQRHLQLRIEAQGKYLQTVLKRAQETLAGYNSSSMGVESARAELSQLLMSMVNSSCQSSSFSELTEIGISSSVIDLESSLTSSESPGRKEEKQPSIDQQKPNISISVVELPLIDVNQEYKSRNNAKKRNRSSAFSDCYCVEQSIAKSSTIAGDKSSSNLRNMLDLNAQYQNDIDSDPKDTDLNCNGI